MLGCEAAHRVCLFRVQLVMLTDAVPKNPRPHVHSCQVTCTFDYDN
jgi:hypothetical protein